MTTASPNGGPAITLIVNTVDRAEPLSRLLRALERQTYPNFEVLAVVGPVHDHTLQVLEGYGDRIRVLRCPAANLSRSRNQGLAAANGDVVAYIDDDAVPCERWLEQLARLFANPNLDGTGGVVYLAHPKQPEVQLRFGMVSSLTEVVDLRSSALDRVAGVGRGAWWAPRPMGTNMAFRRKALLDTGGFDEFYNYIAEETDLALRLAWGGHLVRPVREAPVYHVPASSATREVFTHRGTWWRLATRSFAYYCAKNGRPSGDVWTRVVRRWGSLVYGHWETYHRLRRSGGLSLREAAVLGMGDLAGLAAGVWGGMTKPRQLMTADAAAAQDTKEPEPIRRFLTPESPLQPAVDPVTGRQAAIRIVDPPLRICLISHSYPPDGYDGVGRLTHLMAQGLFELGHSVHVVTGGDREQVSFYDGAYVHRIPYSLDRYGRYRRYVNLFHALNNSHAVADKVRRLVANDGVQIVDSPLWLFEGLVTLMSGVAPVVTRLVTAGRQVAALHGDEGEDFRLIGEMEKALIQRADHVLPNTMATLKAACEAYGLELAADRRTIVPYGIVPARDEDVRPVQVQPPLTNPQILFVGRLEKRKGVTDLFEAIPQVLRRHPGARFTFAGADNSRHDGFQNQEGTDYPGYFSAHYPGCTGAVDFLGEVSDGRLQGLYQSCDLLVAPSLYESFGLIYPEAMNYAKPVIGCRTGGIPEVVDDGVTGLLVDPGAPRQLAEAIGSLLSSPARMREMGLAGRQQVLSRFHYVEMARRFSDVYRAVIAARAAGA